MKKITKLICSILVVGLTGAVFVECGYNVVGSFLLAASAFMTAASQIIYELLG